MSIEHSTGQPNSVEFKNHFLTEGMFTMVVRSKEPARVVIAVPHDGLPARNLFGEHLQPRNAGVKGGDRNIWPIALDIVLGQRARGIGDISVVRGMMPRRYVDYNRGWPQGVNYYPLTQTETETALEDSRLAGIYHAYHRWIEMLLGSAITRYGREQPLLIDLHGFSHQPKYAPQPDGYDLILGTGNRRTILHGEVDRELGRYLSALGYRVFLPEEVAHGGMLEDSYSADYTTRHYAEVFGINCIQIEVASRFRNNVTGVTLGPKLSADLSAFIRELVS